MRQDDVWHAYTLLRGPDVTGAPGGPDATLVWVLADRDERIFASNRPRGYRLDAPLPPTLTSSARPPTGAGAGAGAGQISRLPDGAGLRRLIHLPLASDGTQVGDLFALLSGPPSSPASTKSRSAACW